MGINILLFTILKHLFREKNIWYTETFLLMKIKNEHFELKFNRIFNTYEYYDQTMM